MPLPSAPNPFTHRVRRIARLRQALAVALLVAAVGVLIVYLLNRRSNRLEAGRRPELKVPVLGLKIQQSASGVTISQDEAGRPVFRVFAQRVDKLRQGNREVLHQVRILVYDKDGIHSDQIAGDEFGYDESTYQLSARGQVHIDLQAPSPVHIEASDLTYNVKAGTGIIAQGLTFHYLNAQGSAATARLDSHAGLIALAGGVRVQWQRPGLPDLVIASDQASVQRFSPPTADAAIVILERHATISAGTQSLAADRLAFHLRPNETLRQLDADGDIVAADTAPARPLQVNARQGVADFVPTGLHRTAVKNLSLVGNVAIEEVLPQQRDRLTAGQVAFLFTADHQLAQVQAREDARLSLEGKDRQSVAAPGLDFHFASPAPGDHRAPSQALLTAVESQGRAQVELAASAASGPVHAEADHLHLDLDDHQWPVQALAGGDVRLRQTVAGETRTSRSDRLQLSFASPQTAPEGLAEAIESGRVDLRQGDRDLQADQVVYNTASRKVVLTASPGSAYSHGQVRGSDPQTSFSAPAVTWVSDALGGGDLTATDGVSLSRVSSVVFGSALPMVVTASSLHWTQPPGAHPLPGIMSDALQPAAKAPTTFPGTGVFSGQVRLLQSPNLLRADRLTLNGSSGVLTAEGHVQTSFVQTAAAGLPLAAHPPARPAPITITAGDLRYDQATHEAVYQDQVVMRMAAATLAAPRLEAFLAAPADAQRQVGSLRRALASGGVRITQPGRTASATQVSYDFAQNLVRLAGGPPSIFDAEQGKITGDPLTFSLASDEIQVGSKSGARASGQTIVHK